ncbi:MAG: 3-hydroxyacyl-CoA dehydrogenase, partial [Geminicoccaceae bacterium]
MPALPTSVPVAVVGAGTMGAGIAEVAAVAGHPVLLCDAQPGAAQGALERIDASLARAADKGRLRCEEIRSTRARIRPCHGLDALTSAQLVIEAIAEDLAAKQSLFEALEVLVSPDVVLASNTSSLSITALGGRLKRPGRLVGMHFFNPAPSMALVEVVRGLATAPEVVETVIATASAWGKTAVEVRSSPGFIVNRIARSFYGEALRALAEGAADVTTIDALMREAGGFKMGPFELIDLIGLDVNLAVGRALHAAFQGDARYAPSLIQEEMVAAGRLGRKTRRGFYDYGPDAVRPSPRIARPAPAPKPIVVQGDLGVAEPLLARLKKAGIEAQRRSGEGVLRAGDLRIALTDGRCATEWSHMLDAPVVLFDLALDFSTCRCLALAPADQSAEADRAKACGLFQAAGIQVTMLDDLPGLLVMRTVCMLANEAAEAVHTGVASAEAIERAMQL